MPYETVSSLVFKTVETLNYQQPPPLFLVATPNDRLKEFADFVRLAVLKSGGNATTEFITLKKAKARADFLGADGVFFIKTVNGKTFLKYFSANGFKPKFFIPVFI